MTTDLDTLTEKERQTLRLIGRGHDAKSSARELGLSVHTVNERLRDARRKLGVTSSREAARRLLAEGVTPPNCWGTSLWGMQRMRAARHKVRHPLPSGGQGRALSLHPSECLPCH